MNWRTLKQIPKLAVALAVVITSTALFGFWWRFWRPFKWQPFAPSASASAERAAKSALVAQHSEHLLLADKNLIDLDSGEVLVENWLNGDQPLKLWFDAENQKVIARFERGFRRYNLDGRESGTLVKAGGVIISDDMDLAIYVSSGDVWKAGIDWREFKFTDEARATSVGGFQENFFVQNLVLASKAALVVRNMNQLLRVNLGSGEVVPLPLRVTNAAERRSPDGGVFLGDQTGAGGTTLFAFDVATGDVKKQELGGRTGVTSVLWLDKDHCCILVNAQVVVMYDRAKGSFAELVKLPSKIKGLALPSPSKRYVVVVAQGGAEFLDIEEKRLIPLPAHGQNLDWIADDTVIMANSTMDTNQRGTWVMKPGETPMRINTEPYAFEKGGKNSVLAVREEGVVIFGTQSALFKLKMGGLEPVQFANLKRPALRLQAVEKWVR